MNSPLATVIEEVILKLGPGRPSVDDLVDEVLRRAPDLVEAEASRLVRRSLARQIKDRLRSGYDTDDEYDADQLAFPGFEHVPAHLAVRHPEGVYYVPTRIATYAEIASALEERRQHRRRVDVVVAELEELLVIVAPVMRDDPLMPLSEAIAQLEGAA